MKLKPKPYLPEDVFIMVGASLNLLGKNRLYLPACDR